ncbi:hypothetical protein, partial [Candidatus Halobonum tyrrellensis]|uniref:hypothetical protein n=1 Tax=Candidatus Halobonum tyrrellensis TaxID=1431545 RepID=UPI001F40F4B6
DLAVGPLQSDPAAHARDGVENDADSHGWVGGRRRQKPAGRRDGDRAATRRRVGDAATTVR